MNKILEFFYRHLAFVVFVLLEVFAILLMVNKNDLQRSVVFRYATSISAWTYGVTNVVTDYFGLVESNRLLADENARLRGEIARLEDFVVLNDSVSKSQLQSDVEFVAAKVVYNSVYNVQNYLIVDKGSVDGIEEDMGVFASSGVVGVVQRVSEHYAVVLPIINPDQVISAKIKRNDQIASVEWDGYSPKFAKLEGIPNHIDVQAGDSIVTSGFSAIFPKGILIGVVDKASHSEHTMFCDVDVALAVDFQSLSYVTIALYRDKKELSNLQNSVLK